MVVTAKMERRKDVELKTEADTINQKYQIQSSQIHLSLNNRTQRFIQLINLNRLSQEAIKVSSILFLFVCIDIGS